MADDVSLAAEVVAEAVEEAEAALAIAVAPTTAAPIPAVPIPTATAAGVETPATAVDGTGPDSTPT